MFGEIHLVPGTGASADVAGRPLAVSAAALGVDEMDPENRLDFVAWTQAPRCAAYLGRMRAWEARVGREGREVIPYRLG